MAAVDRVTSARFPVSPTLTVVPVPPRSRMLPMDHNPALRRPSMRNIGKLGATVLGIYLIAVGILPYVPLGIPLIPVLAVVAGVLVLLGR